MIFRSSIPVILRRQTKVVVLVAAALALIATTFSSKLLNIVSHVPFFYSFLFLIILICLFLPIRFLWMSVPTSAGILACLNMGNNFKIAALALPITYFDVEMVLDDPETFVNALGLNDFVWLPYLGLIAIAAIVGPLAAWKIKNRVSFSLSRFISNLLPAISASLLVIFIGQQCLLRYAAYPELVASLATDTLARPLAPVQPGDVVQGNRLSGIFGFLGSRGN